MRNGDKHKNVTLSSEWVFILSSVLCQGGFVRYTYMYDTSRNRTLKRLLCIAQQEFSLEKEVSENMLCRALL